jgi:hypothetical protein
MSSPIFLYLTVAAPGARGDFVAGWLGSLPWVIDNAWTIDPPTGRSFGNQQLLKGIDHISKPNTNDLNNALSIGKWHLDSNATVAYSAAIHGFNINSQVTTDNLSAIKFIVVDSSKANRATLDWECCIKTFGSCDHRKHTFNNNLSHNHIDRLFNDEVITDQDRCEKFNKILLQHKGKKNCNPIVDAPHVTIKYSDVISANGSQILAELLNIDIDPSYHKLWQANLTLATAPESIKLFGQQWHKTMYS